MMPVYHEDDDTLAVTDPIFGDGAQADGGFGGEDHHPGKIELGRLTSSPVVS
jgi:hypothetical protein